MLTRLLSTLALWALVLAAVCWGGVDGGLLLLALVSTLAQHELHGLLAACGLAPWRLPTLALGAAIVLASGLCPPGNADPVWLAAILALGCGLLPVASRPEALARLAGSVFAIAFVPALLQYFSLILRDFGPQCPRGAGLGLAVWTIAASKFTDVGGYAVGSAIGRHKLAPAISPGKTWEGVAGGFVFSAGVAALIAHFAPAFLPAWLTPAHAALLALPIAVATILSDLAESAIKRRAGAKDSGRCIPGIGGALDLVDGLLLAAPAAYYLFSWSSG